MRPGPELLLVAAVAAVGVLHTLVPDHWVPIAVVARRSGWTRAQTAGAAAIAGFGHAASTLAIGVLVWVGGVALALRIGNLISLLAGIALIGFGLWIALASLLEMRRHRNDGHGTGKNFEQNRYGPRTALLFILGSSPMVEGIPAFFAAARFGAGLLVVMAACFAAGTMLTYVALCVGSHAALQNFSFGPLDRYGEVLSGSIIAIVGVVFLLWSPA
jgi:hypothetical protein